MLTEEKLLAVVDETLSWGSELSEMWTGTQFEKLIDLHQSRVVKAVEHKDYKKVEALVGDLAQLLDHAESEYDISE